MTVSFGVGFFGNSYPFGVGMRSDATNVPPSSAVVWSEHHRNAAEMHSGLCITRTCWPRTGQWSQTWDTCLIPSLSAHSAVNLNCL